VAFPFGEHEKMAAKLRAIKERAIVSLSDHPDIRRVFDGFHIETVPIQSTVGGGGRAAERKELIIFSWDDAAQPAGLFQSMTPTRTVAPALRLQVLVVGRRRVIAGEAHASSFSRLLQFVCVRVKPPTFQR
jgi:hypothetical protein